MGMCKGCQQVFSYDKLDQDGLCATCRSNDEVVENTISQQKVQVVQLQKGDIIKSAPIGFSWTALLFNFWVPLLRKDFINAIIMFVATIIVLGIFSVVGENSFIILFAYAIATGFLYNKLYIKGLLKNGYKPYNKISEKTLQELNLGLGGM